jgi:peptidoglycan/LPS O-acetylase OafA/YrhL
MNWNVRRKPMMKWKVLEVLKNKERNSGVDVFRSLAIISVVLLHFNLTMPFGYLGVDLFFVISGLLISGLLTRRLVVAERISYFRFVLERGFKIWPSYYIFILCMILLTLYHGYLQGTVHLIPFRDLNAYLFFYINYSSGSSIWNMDHLWSICVEEHFYAVLPLLFLLCQRWIKEQNRKKFLFAITILTILAGIGFKFMSYYHTHTRDTYFWTHNRVDALAWGVLLNLIITYYPEFIKSFFFALFSLAAGTILIIFLVYFSLQSDEPLFKALGLHSLAPLAFFLLIAGSYFMNFSAWKPLRFIAYFSYNWYLWHPVFVNYFTRHFGNTVQGLLLYVVASFAMAVVATVLVEETVMKKRSGILDKLFPLRKEAQSALVE